MRRITLCFGLILSACSIGMVEQEGTIESVGIHERAHQGNVICEATGEYPHIGNLLSRQVEVNINAYLDDFAHRLATDIEACPDLMKDLVTDGTALRDTTDVQYAIKLLDQKYLSVVLTRSRYFEGAAHPDNTTETVTFDLRDGQPIALKNLFKESVDVETLLTEHIRKTMKKERMESSYPSETSKPIEKFYLTETALTLVDLFDVNALQGLTVEIPLAELAEVLVTPPLPPSTGWSSRWHLPRAWEAPFPVPARQWHRASCAR